MQLLRKDEVRKYNFLLVFDVPNVVEGKGIQSHFLLCRLFFTYGNVNSTMKSVVGDHNIGTWLTCASSGCIENSSPGLSRD